MAKIDVVCPRCSETKDVIRNAHSGSGAQLYRCKHCLKTFPFSYRYNGAKPETHQTIVDMAMNGSGYRDTASVLKISLNTVLRHLKNLRRTR
ncbi:IS1 transposase [Erwinia tracheiphila PSU-1]|nr:IS1 transposase [Erwinia tracheiphila PSU-1]